MKVETCLENLEFFAYHGLYDYEKVNGGKFRIDVTLSENVNNNKSFETLEDVLNYEKVFAIVKKEMEQPRDFIETVAADIITQLKTDYNHLANITVKITKYNPAGKFDGGNASVTLSI
ncbi:MAG: dihydroneopterin aldolase [Bacteroidota bacterium]